MRRGSPWFGQLSVVGSSLRVRAASPDPVVQALTVSITSIVPLATSPVSRAFRGRTLAGSVFLSGVLVCDVGGATQCT
eukprot:1532958-Pyramimonas_sp.AAC.1